jgi:anion transporter
MTNTSIASPPPRLQSKLPLGLLLGVIGMLLIIWAPEQAGLPIAGQRMLGILVFAVVVWITETVSYEISALMIFTLIIGLLGALPFPHASSITYNTLDGLKIALSGFANPALGLVVGALFIAATMSHTGLDRRIALFTLSKIGTSPRRILIGTVIVIFVLSLIVPSATARSACVAAIMMGVIASFNLPLHSNLAAAIMITVAQGTNIWNIGIQTAAAQNILSLGFMHQILGERVTWLEWFIAGAPWAIIMSVVLIWVVMKQLPIKDSGITGGKEIVAASLSELGPMDYAQKYLLTVSSLLLLGWATEGKLHNFDAASLTYAALLLLMLPGLGVITWKDIQSRMPWGVVIVFGVGISLGTALVQTQAAKWLGTQVVTHLPLESLSIVTTFAILSGFLIIIHLGFASATALCSAVLPVLISVLQSLPGEFSNVGVSMMLNFAISFGFILPINSPQNMVCLATNTFSSRQFVKSGLVLTLIGYVLMIVLASTYWKWLGWF